MGDVRGGRKAMSPGSNRCCGTAVLQAYKALGRRTVALLCCWLKYISWLGRRSVTPRTVIKSFHIHSYGRI